MEWTKTKVNKVVYAALIYFCLFVQTSWAAAAFDFRPPASVDPGVLNRILEPKQAQPAVAPPITTPEEKPSGLKGKAAQEVRFQLNKIILEGNTVYSEQQLLPLYQDKLHKLISIADLQDIVQKITNYYRNEGYILTRAILPPQHVANGVVRIRVIEGFIDQVHVVGNPKKAKYMLQNYGEKIAKHRPLKLSTMEYYLRLANEIPGVQVKAVLEPSKTVVGASDLNLTSEMQTFQGYVSYDDYGTLYLGPLQLTGSANVNSTIRSGDTARLFYITTTRPQELKYTDISYQTLMGTEGVSFLVGGNGSVTQPGLNLRELKIKGTGSTYYGTLNYPLVRTREEDFTLNSTFNYLDSQTTTGITSPAQTLFTDHVRSINAGFVYNFSDRFRGINYLNIYAEQGLNILGATHDKTSFFTSRFGANGVYTKIVPSFSRTQMLFNRFSFYLMTTGQYSFQPLLASEQFAFGGSQMGRGYSPAEIIGDQGFGGTAELRVQFAPGKDLLQSFQPYIFYDGGVIWNRKNVVNVQKKQSITSTGGGIRFSMTNHVFGNFMVAQPLTKQNSAEEVVGRGRRLQSYFSVTASL